MSKYILKAPNMPPTPEGFIYKQYESGAKFSAMSHVECAGLVLNHRIANGYPRATYDDCVSDIIDQTCILMGPDYCVNTEFERVAFSDGWDRVVAGTKRICFIGDRAQIRVCVAGKCALISLCVAKGSRSARQRRQFHTTNSYY